MVLNNIMRKRIKKISEQRVSGLVDHELLPKDLRVYDDTEDDGFVLDLVWDSIYRQGQGGTLLPFTHLRKEFHFPIPEVDDQSYIDNLKSASVFVAIHPDQATEAVIDAALHLGVPFAVLPCCVFGDLFPHRTFNGLPVRTYSDFIPYLMAKHPSIELESLPFMGRNQVLYRL